MAEAKKAYYLGLDIGTNSVGWAVTDPEYNVIKKNGKALWGVRLFAEANTAAERRAFRGARRRLQRRKQRINLLQELFAAEIAKVDMGFFQRLEESRLYVEDRSEGNRQKNALFNDVHFKDKDYFQNYATIYHLRKELMESREPHDIRLVYLAIHHILKHRGHFLFAGKKLNEFFEIKTAYENLIQVLRENLDIDIEANVDELERTLKNKDLGVTKKSAELRALFGVDKSDKQAMAVLKLLAGAKGIKLSDIFEDESFDEVENNKVSFSESGSDEKLEQIVADFPETEAVLLSIKALYDWSILAEILAGSDSLSKAKVEIYEKHRKDLCILKDVIRTDFKENYNRLFRDPEEKNNYCAYVGSYSVNGKNDNNSIAVSRCSKEDFYGTVKKILKSKEKEGPDIQYILEEIEHGTFMPLQVIKDNGVIPNQLHKNELEKILDNAASYLPFLNEKDENGLSVRDKILGTKNTMGLIDYRIPYYVGPINTHHKDKGFSWAERKAGIASTEKIYPWNFNEKIDTEKSAENFILRMTNKCSYLLGENVLPKDSLLYSKFMVLNEINNITLSGEKIPVEVKQEIYSELFCKRKKIKRKDLENFFINKGYKEAIEAGELGGFDGDFKASLASYIDLRKVSEYGIIPERDFEEIIKDIVLFGEDKKMLKGRLSKEFPYLTDEQIKFISRLKYKEWGRLSRRLLEEIVAPDTDTGEAINIIRHMWDTNDNLMQTLRGELGYREEIERFNQSEDTAGEITYRDVEDMYISPKVKRSVWQTITIVNEIRKIIGSDPQRVFIEVTRGEDEKKERKSSRKQQLLELYKSCKDEERDWISEINQREEGEFRNNLLYLYYTQMGRDMYTGKPIDLDSLFNGNLYDKDHIWPRSKTKDDSIQNNLVLVNKIDNAATKSDKYPVPLSIREKMTPFWKMLLAKGFITKVKYERLTRKTGFTDEELAGFINRQLVETSQSNKAVAELLTRMLPDSDIVYSKAKNVTEFRHQYQDHEGYVKVREINDYHHAKDAYLNIVVGNVYHTKFTQDPIKYIRENSGEYNLKRLYDFEVKRGDCIAWVPGKRGTIATVDRWMRKNNILFTRLSYEEKGGFFHQKAEKKGKGKVKIKNNEKLSLAIEKYGGYDSVKGAYYIIVEATHKQKKKRTIEVVPAYLSKAIENQQLSLEEYCCKFLGLEDPRILLSKIKIDSLFELSGFRMHLSGKSDDYILMKSAKQLCLSDEYVRYIKKVIKFLNEGTCNGISEEKNLELYRLLFEILKNSRYKVMMKSTIKNLTDKEEAFKELPIEKQCSSIAEILKVFQCNSLLANLKAFGETGSGGKIRMHKDITKAQELYLVYQSPTGFFEQKVELSSL